MGPAPAPDTTTSTRTPTATRPRRPSPSSRSPAVPDMLQLDFMVRALAASALVGLTAPVIGVFLVQRRLALLGDGIGHVALTGVGLGFLTHHSPVLTALAVSVVGAVLIELVRTHTRTSGDLALALLFYGGIAGGVFLTGLAPG